MHRALRALCTVGSVASLAACGHMSATESGLNTDLALADQLHQHAAPSALGAPELAPAVPAPRLPRTTSVTPTVAPARHARTAEVPPVVRQAMPVVVAERTVTGTMQSTTQGGTYSAGDVAGGEVVESPAVDRDGAESVSGARDVLAEGSTSAPVASVPRTSRQPQVHAVRDGVFGSVAGAIIGAATSRGDRVRGGLIGAVAGGALGTVYGRSAGRTFPTYGRTTYGSTYGTYSSYRRY